MDNTTQALIDAAQQAAQAKNNIITVFIIATIVFIAYAATCLIVHCKAESQRSAYESQRRRRGEQVKADAEQADVDFYAHFGRATR